MPLGVLVAASFNDSRLTTVWNGFSLRWYAAVWDDPVLMEAAGRSLLVAVAAATVATALGALAGVALARRRGMRGRAAFAALIAAPVVLPDLLVGLALLLLFVALEQATGFPQGRGLGTVIVAHATIGLGFVALAVQARLAGSLGTLEEAAADLGAGPWVAFRRVTLPRIAPALLAGWLLAFTLSLDDVVVASFTSGPGATTLPMAVFSTLRLGPTPVLNALATVMLVLAAVVLALAWRLVGPGRR